MEEDDEGFVERPARTRKPRNLNVGPGTNLNGEEKKPVQKTAPTRKRSLKDDIARALTYLNFAFYFLPPMYHADALDPAEIEALSTALDKKAQANSRVYKLIESAVTGAATGNVLIVAGIILSRRLARHGVIPEQLDILGGQLLSVSPDDLTNYMAAAEADAGLTDTSNNPIN